MIPTDHAYEASVLLEQKARRERIATMLLAAMLTRGIGSSATFAAREAAGMADILIAELDR